MGASYPAAQRNLLLDFLLRDIQAKADETGTSSDSAFLSIAVRDLGFDADSGFRTDGAGDYGFDHVEVGEREATVFQAKSVDFASTPFDGRNAIPPDKLADLYRIKEVLGRLTETPNGANEELRKALDELRTQITRAANAASQAVDGASPGRVEAEDFPFTIHVVLVAMGERLTANAQQEFLQLADASWFDFHGVKVGLRFGWCGTAYEGLTRRLRLRRAGFF